MASNLWDKQQLLQVLQLYCITPFGRLHRNNPDIIALAGKLGRTPSSVALKMTNFASLDPTIEQKGMSNTSRLDREVWNEFFNMLMSSLAQEKNANNTGLEEQGRTFDFDGERQGLDVWRQMKSRLNQDFFRRTVLASYDFKCALTGIDTPELLIASHIVPWSENTSVRTAPQNGICLNALHDRAFDRGLMAFDDDYSVIYSGKLPKTARDVLTSIGASKLRLPSKFAPNPALLAQHRKTRFQAF